ncbi:MAG: Ig-like domain-containing protein [Clostridia bacterium]
MRRLPLLLGCLIALFLSGACAARAAEAPIPTPQPVLVSAITITTKTGENQLLVGDTLALFAKVLPEDATNQLVAWSVDDSSIASIDQQGVVTGLKVGTVVVTASAKDASGVKATLLLTIKPILVESVELSLHEKQLMVGGRWPISAKVLPEDATDPTLQWISEDEQVIALQKDEFGAMWLVATGAAGKTTGVTARAVDESAARDSCRVKLTTPVTDVLVWSPEDVSQIKRGDQTALAAELLPSDASREIKWTTDNAQIARVTPGQDGKVTVLGTGGGTVTLTASAQDGSGRKGTYELFVRVPIESVTLSGESALFIGETLTLTPTLLPKDTTDRTVRWSSDDEKVATVDAHGVVHGVATGRTRIIARSAANPSLIGEGFVTVNKPVTAIVLNAETSLLGVGGTLQMKAVVSPFDASNRAVAWLSSDDGVATVGENGLVTGVKAGHVVIQAKALDGSGTLGALPLTVSDKLTRITLPGEISVMPGESYRITPILMPHGLGPVHIAWKSEHPEIASVSDDGLLTGRAVGTTLVTAEAGDHLTATCRVTVSQQLSSLELYVLGRILPKGEDCVIDVGQALLVSAVARPAGIPVDLVWKTSHRAIATVDADGNIQARKTGTATLTVTATMRGGTQQVVRRFKLRVVRPVTQVLLPERVNVLAGQSQSVGAVVLPNTATDKRLTWSSADPNIATVNARGVVTGVAKGKTLLTATSQNLLVGLTHVEVLSAVSSITLAMDPSIARIQPGDQVALAATVLPAGAKQALSWSSSNSSVARVSQDGLVTARAPGSVRIVATATDGSKTRASLKLSISASATKIKLNKANITLYTNGATAAAPKSLTLKARISPAAAKKYPLVWTSSDQKIATVTSGTVTAVSDGACVISATTENGKVAQTLVQVQTLPTSIAFKESLVTLVKGERRDFSPLVTMDGSARALVWKSSRPSVASVDKAGVLHARKPGSVLITVRAPGGLKASIAVSVHKLSPVPPAPTATPTPTGTPAPTVSPAP